mgnify:CR=1 FL=1
MMKPFATICLLCLMVAVTSCATRRMSHSSRLAHAKQLLVQKDYTGCRDVFRCLAEAESTPPAVAAESLYWMAEAYAAEGDFTNAYRTAKRLVWDYPSGMWTARYSGKMPLWNKRERTQPNIRQVSPEAAPSAAPDEPSM